MLPVSRLLSISGLLSISRLLPIARLLPIGRLLPIARLLSTDGGLLSVASCPGLLALAGRAPNPYGAQPAAPAGDVVASVAPTRSTAAGNCRADPSPDRQSVSLLGPDALPKQHVPLGEYRVQQVVHSPDGRWAVAFIKLRGQPSFALISLDLARCEAQNTVDLPAAGEDARFEGDEAIVTLGGKERRVRLASSRVR